MELPDIFRQWLAARRWTLLPHQMEMLARLRARQSTLLVAPTGCGKTLAGFLPSLVDLHANPQDGIHTLYISPLKALTADIHQNLERPIHEMGLKIRVETRTGDTPAHKRTRQSRDPPQILLTTPESLMLMLTHGTAARLFANLRSIIVDEVHSIAPTKRGDLTTLAMAQLRAYAPDAVRFGLSATVADKDAFRRWLGPTGCPALLLEADITKKPDVTLFQDDAVRVPFTGFMGKYAVQAVYRMIREASTTLVFVNTRAQAELFFGFLWDANEDSLPIALYHGSLSREQRRKTETMMAKGKLRAVVATSALELGIDWGDVDLVIQLGAPKGVSRLLQRIGRSNHRIDMPSRAILVPSNRFEILECTAAIDAIARGALDGDAPERGARDVCMQFIMTAACAAPVDADALYALVTTSWSYAHLTRAMFDQLLRFVQNGGYVLSSYARFQRILKGVDGLYRPASPQMVRRHRQNIGVIVEAAKLKVLKQAGRRGRGVLLGDVEEGFAQGLAVGDTFFFAGQVLEFTGVRDMVLETKSATSDAAKVPAYAGSQMPLSTFLANGVRELLAHPDQSRALPEQILEWLDLQRDYSMLPGPDKLVVESFRQGRVHFLVLYTFEGRKANQTLGMLVSRRMERLGLKPMSFTITDYGLAISSFHPVQEQDIAMLVSPDILTGELEEWISESPMLKRAFRHVAMVSGLTEQNHNQSRKSMKQVTFSTDLIYDTLLRHEPDHILLSITREEAERELLDIPRLAALLVGFENRIAFRTLKRPSPFAIPILLDVRTERVHGGAVEALLAQPLQEEMAQHMMDDVRGEL